MDKLPSLGTDIFTVLRPTQEAFFNELLKNKESIYSIPRTTHKYGAHPRQQLDFYAAPSPSTGKYPILIFLYGGGFQFGDKIVNGPGMTEPLVYHNLGSWFAQRGYTTIVADYRRVVPGEDAVFPSGGEDVAAVLTWLKGYLKAEEGNAGGKNRDVFLMGNSAGGCHVATYLLYPRWKEERLRYIAGDGALRLAGGLLLSIPAHFDNSPESRLKTHTAYFGSVEGIKNFCPRGLLISALNGKESRTELGIPAVLTLIGEFEPTDEIINANLEFFDLWQKQWDGIMIYVAEKHNHVSVPWALGTGDEEGEKWAVDVVNWMDGNRK